MYTTLICDGNAKSLEEISLAINKEPQYRVVAQAYDGKTAISLIEQYRPDIIILDIILPEYDGVYIVNYVRKNMREYTPIIYILSGFGTNPVVRALNELGVDFYSMKPVSMGVVVRNLNTLIRQRDNAESIPAPNEDSENNIEPAKQESLEDAIKNILLRLGIMPHRISSKCIMDALVINMYNPESSYMLTKVLYPQVAKRHGLNNSSVEKNIRNAISQMQRNNTDMYNEIFYYSTKDRITNGEFLSVMSDYISRYVKNGNLRLEN